MQRVDVILDMEPDYLMDNNPYNIQKKTKKHHEKTIRIPEKIFDIARQEGYIQKTDDGYVFVGKYKDIKALKKKKY